MLRRAVWLVGAVLLAAVFAGCGGSRGSGGSLPGSTMSAAVAANPDVDAGGSAGNRPAPGFTLRDQSGRATSLAQFRGKVVALAFVDSHCTTICPLTTASMVDAVRLLGPLAGRVQLLGIDANPDATRVADVADYTRAHGLEGKWRFLTGSRTQLERVWRAYHVYVAAVHGNIDHQPIVILIDGKGRERTIYETPMRYGGVSQQGQILADGMARLVPGHPAVAGRVSLGYVRPLRPTARTSLTSLGHGGSAVLGRGHPHLLVFFASWLQEGGPLRARLAALDRYAAAAHAHGMPSPVAVDELDTETSPAAVQRRLVQLAATLRYPLVEDTAGRLADGYRVRDLPWLALTSPSGKIVWHHDGWLPAAAIERHVRAAAAAG
jgi:cytochrome oxidase Cu insertion factor (SCO1/SenC/PrrC family)